MIIVKLLVMSIGQCFHSVIDAQRYLSQRNLIRIKRLDVYNLMFVYVYGAPIIPGRFMVFAVFSCDFSVFQEYWCGFSVLQTVAVRGNWPIFDTVFGFILYL